ncbi:hypothetical protein RIF29_25497 [Crotalaria pallida]|uniref:Uncharacterized protein n=1 Tax=Crotalaria pallida TaxID=3830 RepID=A0AAN9HZC4_CROPI
MCFNNIVLTSNIFIWNLEKLKKVKNLLNAAFRRYDATGWLRKMVGVVAAKDLLAEPSEEEALLSAFRYFENVRNFLLAIQEIGIPTFETPDLEQVDQKPMLQLFRFMLGFVK